MKAKKILFYVFLVLTVGINVFIIVEGALNGSQSSQQSEGITQAFIDFVKTIDPNSGIVTNPGNTHYVIRKLIGHYGLFALSGLITTTMFVLSDTMLKKHKALIMLCGGFIGIFVAFASEFMQLLTPGRVFSFIDMLIDLAGYLGWGGILFLIVYLIYKKKERVAYLALCKEIEEKERQEQE